MAWYLYLFSSVSLLYLFHLKSGKVYLTTLQCAFPCLVMVAPNNNTSSRPRTGATGQRWNAFIFIPSHLPPDFRMSSISDFASMLFKCKAL
jgi:hypothetical protein